MQIAVLGGGNGAYAAAADFTEQGHAVRFWRRDAAGLTALREAGGEITLEDHRGTRRVRPALVSDELGEVVRGAQLILAPVPAFAQADIARAIAPFLADGQTILLPPGSFGSYVMARIVR